MTVGCASNCTSCGQTGLGSIQVGAEIVRPWIPGDGTTGQALGSHRPQEWRETAILEVLDGTLNGDVIEGAGPEYWARG
ncbi:hypothetical protein NDU88_003300 [Pleurodeles waltl]|uniref:Uncharacterized protein n=1 Tax=Pleurodeles waltl TaxID=8319 RepID=A0AAV7QBR4_PLEWA|nr:hypothetical protein NDU88_003300 [Pleurodeles waltl]